MPRLVLLILLGLTLGRNADATSANFAAGATAQVWQLGATGGIQRRPDLAVAGAGTGIWDWDLGARRTYYSPQFQALLGYDRWSGDRFETEVATVEDTHQEQRLWARLNGVPAIKVSIRKQPDGNTVATAEARAVTWPPRWFGSTAEAVLEGEPDLLAACHRNSLRLAASLGARTVAFPAISCGAYRFPITLAAQISIRTVQEEAARLPRMAVTFVLFDEISLRAWGKALDDKESAWAWQLIAGVRYAISSNIDLGLKYRYFRTGSLDFADDSALALLGIADPEGHALGDWAGGAAQFADGLDAAARARSLQLLDQLDALPLGESRLLADADGRRYRAQRGHFFDRGFARHFLLVEELTEELESSERATYEKLVRVLAHEVNNTVAATGSGRSA